LTIFGALFGKPAMVSLTWGPAVVGVGLGCALADPLGAGVGDGVGEGVGDDEPLGEGDGEPDGAGEITLSVIVHEKPWSSGHFKRFGVALNA
jgi:hypothetical protein